MLLKITDQETHMNLYRAPGSYHHHRGSYHGPPLRRTQTAEFVDNHCHRCSAIEHSRRREGKAPAIRDGAVWRDPGAAEESRLEGVLHRLSCERNEILPVMLRPEETAKMVDGYTKRSDARFSPPSAMVLTSALAPASTPLHGLVEQRSCEFGRVEKREREPFLA